MILERAIFAIQPGHADAFAEAFAKARPLIENSPGCRKTEMRRGMENPDSFLLLVWWDDLDSHIRGFRESEAFAKWRTLLGPHFAVAPSVEHYDTPA